jgi:tripartite-type tricarboxylate transporter receptor subunit TctC
MTLRRQFLQTAVACATGLMTTSVLSQGAWPAKPINYLVAFPAGGTTDILARLVTLKLNDACKHQTDFPDAIIGALSGHQARPHARAPARRRARPGP